jgi:integrase
MALSALFVSRAKAGRGEPGKHYDGGNLILRIKPGGRASWVFRFSRNGKQTSLGLGSLKDVSLGDARELAAEHRRTLALDGDPLREKRARRAANVLTFDQAAARCIEDRKSGWRDKRAEATWTSTLATYASPVIGKLALPDIDTQHIIAVLKPIWNDKPETASRVRGRIEAVLDWSKLHGHRSGENPGRWRGHLSLVFSAVGKVHRPKHHAALPIDLLPLTFDKLGGLGTIAAEAVMFTVLTVARPGEVQQATWDEIDLEAACWSLPAPKTKSGKPHRTPLSDQALAILKRRLADRRAGEDRIFPGPGKAARLWPDDMLAALRSASDSSDATTHGCRACFDDWCHEKTSFPSKLVDAALQHGPRSRTIAAYRRSDLYEQRRPMMVAWGKFLLSSTEG